MTKNDVIALINQRILVVEDQLRLINTGGVIELHNSICYFPDSFLTIDVDRETRKPIISGKVLATQFSPETAREICNKVTNGLGESPVVIAPKDFYEGYIKSLREQIELLNA